MYIFIFAPNFIVPFSNPFLISRFRGHSVGWYNTRKYDPGIVKWLLLFLRVYFSFVHFGQVSAALNKLGQHLNILSSRGFSGLSRGGELEGRRRE